MTSATEETCLAINQTPLTPEHTITDSPEDMTPPPTSMPIPVADPIPIGSIATPPVTDDHENDDTDSTDVTSSLERDHPSFSKATISVIIQLLPEDGHADGRLALIAVKSHNLPAHMTMQRLRTLGPLPDAFTTLLNQWESALPEALSQRTLDREKEHALQQLKDAERKAQRTATKRPENKKPEKSKQVIPVTTPSAPSAVTPMIPVIPESQPHLF